MSGPIVCKFGGTSLASADQFRKVAEIVDADPQRQVVVPSAPGRRNPEDPKVTDLLILCHEAASQGVGFADAWARISERFHRIAKDLGLSTPVQGLLDEAHAGIVKTAGLPHGLDFAASRGEAINGRLLADLLGVALVDPTELIRFTAEGQLDSDRTYPRIAETLSRHDRAVVPGFYGSGPDGEVRTFSRGGSDVTGAVLARGMQASVYENWTDVPGMLITDPRIVPEAYPIEVVTYKELRELSYSGASVLHEDAVFPVREAEIPVLIRSTNEPSEPGTRIVSSTSADAATSYDITGIAGRTGFTIFNIEKAMMNSIVGFGRRVLQVLEDRGINFEHMPSGIDTLSLVVDDAAMAEPGARESLADAIQASSGADEISVVTGMALVATVGRGMMRTPGMSGRLFSALGDAGVNIRMIDQGSSELNIIVGVDIDDYETAVRAIYKAFVEEYRPWA